LFPLAIITRSGIAAGDELLTALVDAVRKAARDYVKAA
jgi:hypothetical protein